VLSILCLNEQNYRPMSIANIETFLIFQYSNGVGHLNRCSAIAKAFSAISHVTMFSGGKPIPGYSAPFGVNFVQLPAIRWERTAESSPAPVDPSCTITEVERMRSELLVHSYFRIRPQIIIIEYFPFAPKRFGNTLNELFDVINQEQNRPIVICSIRTYPRLWDTDVDATWINEQLRKNFSFVLHHTDPKLFPLSSLGPYLQAALSSVTVWQTGFIRRSLIRNDSARASSGLLLTVGGGSTRGATLLKRWINGARAGSPELFPINAVCGPMMDSKDRKSIHAEQSADVTVHDWVANMDDLLSSCRAVVCMGGYNTLVETLSLRKPVLAFPHSGMGDQAFQVNALYAQGMLLKGDQSQSENEITALMNQLLKFRPQHPIDSNGTDRSVEIVKHLVSAS
jgi:predicted glycosyltransferase